MTPLLSIIVTCPKGRLAQFSRGLNSLYHQSFDPGLVELLFFNDGAEPEVMTILTRYSGKFPIRYFSLRKRRGNIYQSASRRNFLIRQSSGKYIVITDPEVVHASQTIQQSMNAFNKYGDRIWYCGKVFGTASFATPDGNFSNLVTRNVHAHEFKHIGEPGTRKNRIDLSFYTNNRAYHFIHPKKVEVVMFCTAVAKKELVRVRGFNERMRVWGYDDVDLYYRLKSRGVIRVFDPKFIAYHLPHRIGTPLVERIAWNMYNTHIPFMNDSSWGTLDGEKVREEIL